MHSQAARENAPLTCTSVAVVNVWTLAWYVMASPTVPTVQMRVLDVLNATAPVCRLLSVTTSVSAPRMAQSVQNRCGRLVVFLCCFRLNLSMLWCNNSMSLLTLCPLFSVQMCYCAAGFRLDLSAVSCVDTDECNAVPNTVCRHTCLNTHGSYSCHCHPGFYLEPDSKSCKTKGIVCLLFILYIMWIKCFLAADCNILLGECWKFPVLNCLWTVNIVIKSSKCLGFGGGSSSTSLTTEWDGTP